mmetsp:Transcript_37404/g.75497  ORF Transcript_37404/g.75497 Transcript_37404/m.75497 type:complete len:217 (+) Transcript_37404:83-733(+)|eukprot:CAMPEP_0113819710 /NCGR_PEP_ID=MMETSP0328-20130328/875_1 /TAXON_ID=39455 /ORGANISM="Alexandrium minutum" /LENGTH=216 /DNA_ID=CAMNT_0000787643 /DNA_START=82 /DNA_END=732 /DNA_ORIENTATION=- /assembly_acc=CAM_ASM_000350
MTTVQVIAADAPAQQSMTADDVSIVPMKREDLETERLRQVTYLHKVGLSDAKPCCCCFSQGYEEVHKTFRKGLLEADDLKLEVFGIAVTGGGDVVGYVMLGFHDTAGDVCMRDVPCLMSALKPRQGTCHLEQIVVGERARGKGVSTKLLTWADNKARARGCKKIHLEVIGRNRHAKQVYEKFGYKVHDSMCEHCYCCPVLCCLMRVPYLHNMEKDL